MPRIYRPRVVTCAPCAPPPLSSRPAHDRSVLRAGPGSNGDRASTPEPPILHDPTLLLSYYAVLGQLVFSTVRAPILRITIALIFAAPAALAGYHATYGLSGLTTSSDLVREVFAVIGAIVTGATAWTRLAASPTAVSAGPGRPALS